MAVWAVQLNGWTAFLDALKIGDNSRSAVTSSTKVTDNDTDKYEAGTL